MEEIKSSWKIIHDSVEEAKERNDTDVVIDIVDAIEVENTLAELMEIE